MTLRDLLPILLGGVIGLATNWIAIVMLFRPHRPRPWLPFWRQGLVPRERRAIAAQIGEVVGQELLGPEPVRRLLAGEEGRRRSDELLSMLVEAALAELSRRPLGEFLRAAAWTEWARALGRSLQEEERRGAIRSALAGIVERSLAAAGAGSLEEKLGPAALLDVEARLARRLAGSDWSRKAEGLLDKGKWFFTPAFVADRLAKKQGRSAVESASHELAHLLVASLARQSLLDLLDLGEEEARRRLAEEMAEGLLDHALTEEALGRLADWARQALGPLLAQDAVSLAAACPEERLAGLREILEERLHEALAAHAADLLRGADVPGLVRTRIDEYPIAELERLVLDVSGRHLGWITVWGGILGALLGALQLLLR